MDCPEKYVLFYQPNANPKLLSLVSDLPSEEYNFRIEHNFRIQLQTLHIEYHCTSIYSATFTRVNRHLSVDHTSKNFC